ncbi:unnamed protein product [Durusdinium trenchii]|uniref:Uncharacterized protein n=2 Tax=Durusdinium trenchii TaxID=1381693 RepID=A0ABP0Q7J2_9DINO
MLWTFEPEKMTHDPFCSMSRTRQALPRPTRTGHRHSVPSSNPFWLCCSHSSPRRDPEACQSPRPYQSSRPTAQSFDLRPPGTAANHHVWSPEPWAREASVSLTNPSLAAGAEQLEDCKCCTAQEVSRREALPTLDAVRTLTLKGDLEEVIRADDRSLEGALAKVFGLDGVSAIFGSTSADGAKKLHCSGFNHVFMIQLGGKLAKCIRPHGGAGGDFSEVLEAERLRCQCPSLLQDPQVLFPEKSFLCKDQTRYVCEVLVFEFIPKCQSIADLCRDFERTHPCGVRRQMSSCGQHRGSEVGCDHAQALRDLTRQAAHLGRHFQAAHGRRHGDFKANNVLVDEHGRMKLADFLSPFCTACDRQEFQTSIQSSHPIAKDLQQVFEAEWQGGGEAASEASLRKIAWLVAEIQSLTEASNRQSLFGPLPDLLQSISSWTHSKAQSGTSDSLDENNPIWSPAATKNPSDPSPRIRFERSPAKTQVHMATVVAGVPPLPLGHESSIFAEPNLLDHAKSMIAASQESAATTAWETPSWAGCQLLACGCSTDDSHSGSSPAKWPSPGFGDSGSYKHSWQANRSPQRVRRTSALGAASPFFPFREIAMHKASLRVGDLPQ